MKQNKTEEKKAELKEKFLIYFRALPIQKLAAGYIGKSEDTICDWKNQDPEFANQINIMGSEWAQEKAKGVKSKEWLLERVMNDHFGQKTKTDITSGGEKIQPILGGSTVEVVGDVPSNDSNAETSTTQKEN